MMSATAIVQARMGSTRLPGKVLSDLAGRPVLAWVIDRLSQATSLSSVVVATTTLPEDDSIVEVCRAWGAPVFRGSQHDVLDRYCQASRMYPSDVVVRVTADCPLIDPSIVDRAVGELLAPPRADYASNVADPRTFPRGLDVEAFTAAALEEAWRRDNSSWREHVTPFIYRNPELFNLRAVVSEHDLSMYRWTVDTQADLEAVRALVEVVPDPNANWLEYAAAIRRRPHLANINNSVTQKPVL